MKQKITMLLLFIGLNTIAQIKFEKGYFISNNGIKTECFIKNEDWLNNPSKFLYKTELNSKVLTATIEKVKEFKISNKLYYIRFSVLIDESSSVMGQLSDKRTSDFTQKKLFLKLLVDGKSKLYSYTKKNLIRYFYKKNNGVKQLEYKLYNISQVQIAKNINYIKQLNDFFPCQNIFSFLTGLDFQGHARPGQASAWPGLFYARQSLTRKLCCRTGRKGGF